MTDRAKWGTTTEWVLVLAAIFSALLLGAGAWIGMSTGNWLALVLAVGLTVPVEILLFTRQRRRTIPGTSATEQTDHTAGDQNYETPR